MQPIPFIPAYKFILRYDIRPEHHHEYIRYVLSEFFPTAQSIGLYLLVAWHIAYGEYPMREIVLVADSLDTARSAFADERWEKIEAELKSYTTNYSTRLIPYKNGFQV